MDFIITWQSWPAERPPFSGYMLAPFILIGSMVWLHATFLPWYISVYSGKKRYVNFLEFHGFLHWFVIKRDPDLHLSERYWQIQCGYNNTKTSDVFIENNHKTIIVLVGKVSEPLELITGCITQLSWCTDIPTLSWRICWYTWEFIFPSVTASWQALMQQSRSKLWCSLHHTLQLGCCFHNVMRCPFYARCSAACSFQIVQS